MNKSESIETLHSNAAEKFAAYAIYLLLKIRQPVFYDGIQCQRLFRLQEMT